MFGLNRIQLLVVLACLSLVVVVIMFPPWRQTHDGHPLDFKESLGHHALWSAPAATGEDSWIIKVSPAECKVAVNWRVPIAQCAMIAVVGVVLCFVLRRKRTRRMLIYTSLLLALCIPFPPVEGIPLLVWVVGGLLAPLSDTGHLNPFGLFASAIKLTVIYSAATFALLSALDWFAHERSGQAPD